jgi:hypothetical protein
VDAEVGNANLCKEFVDFSCSSIRFELGSYYVKLRRCRRRGCSIIREEVKVKGREISK